MARFEVGRTYECYDRGFSPVTVIKRTARMIKVKNDCGSEWRMLIRRDENGEEFAQDSSVNGKWALAFRYFAKWEAKSEAE